MIWVIRVTLIIVCGVVLYFASTFGIANIHYSKAYNQLVAWGKVNPRTIEQEKYDDTLNAINRALELHPNYAHYYVIQGKTFEWGERFKTQGDTIQKSMLLQAKSSYTKATELRPSWPESWIGLIVVKVLLEEFDDQLSNYIANAGSYAPYNERLNLILSKLLIQHWSKLAPDLIQQLIPHLLNVLQTKQKRTFTRYVETVGQKAFMCAILKTQNNSNTSIENICD
jgi:tetratricopeptide (TPR) repeat protein